MVFPEPRIYFFLFADDTTVLIEGHEYQKLIKTLNEELCKVDKWFQWRSEGIWRPGANLNLAPPPLKKIPKNILI